MTKFLILLAVVLSLIYAPALGWCGCDEARIIAAKGIASFKKDPRSGLISLKKACQMCPYDRTLAYNLGVAYYLSGLQKNAYNKWSILAQDNGDSRLYVNLGWLALELKKTDEAEAWRKKSEDLNPSDPNAVALHVEILFAKNKPKEALDIAALNKGRVPFKISKAHLEKVTEGIWETYKSGAKADAAAEMKDAIRQYPEIKKLQKARDLMRVVFFDKSVEITGHDK